MFTYLWSVPYFDDVNFYLRYLWLVAAVLIIQ